MEVSISFTHLTLYPEKRAPKFSRIILKNVELCISRDSASQWHFILMIRVILKSIGTFRGYFRRCILYSIAYCRCRVAVKLFRFLLSPYSLIEIHDSMQNCRCRWLTRRFMYFLRGRGIITLENPWLRGGCKPCFQMFISSSFSFSFRTRTQLLHLPNLAQILGGSVHLLALFCNDTLAHLSLQLFLNVYIIRLMIQWKLCPSQGRVSLSVGRRIIGEKLCGLSPRANYTDRATAACQRS
jgi:hypothetical protein